MDKYTSYLLNYYDRDILMHHGIKGQKWGVRRFQNPDGTWTNAGKERRNEGRSGEARDAGVDNKTRHKGRPDLASAFSIGVDAYYATKFVSLAAQYGPVAVSSVMPITATLGILSAGRLAERVVNIGSAMSTKRTLSEERSGAKIDKETGLLKKTRELSETDDLSRINPDRYTTLDTDFRQNCMNCTMAYDLRRRGFDVQAGRDSSGKTVDSVTRYYPKAKIETVKHSGIFSGKTHKETLSRLASQGEGARGNLMVHMLGGSGHSVAYQVKNGRVMILDGQVNKTSSAERFLRGTIGDVSFARTDNVTPDYKTMKKDGVIR